MIFSNKYNCGVVVEVFVTRYGFLNNSPVPRQSFETVVITIYDFNVHYIALRSKERRK